MASGIFKKGLGRAFGVKSRADELFEENIQLGKRIEDLKKYIQHDAHLESVFPSSGQVLVALVGLHASLALGLIIGPAACVILASIILALVSVKAILASTLEPVQKAVLNIAVVFIFHGILFGTLLTLAQK